MRAALKLKCPKCAQSNLFTDPNPYHFKKLGDMPVVCPNCALPFTPEPGFYYGAMYVSYALTVAMSVFNFDCIISTVLSLFTKPFFSNGF